MTVIGLFPLPPFSLLPHSPKPKPTLLLLVTSQGALGSPCMGGKSEVEWHFRSG